MTDWDIIELPEFDVACDELTRRFVKVHKIAPTQEEISVMMEELIVCYRETGYFKRWCVLPAGNK